MNIEKCQKKPKTIGLLIQAFFVSYACSVQFQKPLLAGAFAEPVDFYTAQVYALLGQYHFRSILIFLMAFCCLNYVAGKVPGRKEGNGYVLPAFFAFCLFMGKSYAETGSWAYCFGDGINLVKFAIAMVGMTIILQKSIGFLLLCYEKAANCTFSCKITNWLFGKKCLLKNTLLILFCWSPAIMLSYPGNLCYDVIGQLDQVVGGLPYSAHHPLLHTLVLGGIVKFGGSVLGSYERGLFLYVLLQSLMLAVALAGTIRFLARREKKASHVMLSLLLGSYVLAPVYSNVASTPLKDVPFVAVFIWYVIMLAEIYQDRSRLKEVKFSVLFVLVQVLVCLLRNNGFYVVFFTGIVLSLLWWKGADRKQRACQVAVLFLAPVLLSKLINTGMIAGLSAEEGKAAEMFSLPFQQTARYLQLYRHELNGEQKEAIARVLGNADAVAASYDPKIADPVKAYFYDHQQVGFADMLEYFKVWLQCFIKHPNVYFEAFFAHVYGWFDPQVSNAVRYEAAYDLIPREGLFPNADKALVFLYRFADRITPLGLLQNVGAYTWAMLILLRYTLRKNRNSLVLFIPSVLSLLICMASPCFYLHPRYAFPYMFTIPFMYGFIERRSKG